MEVQCNGEVKWIEASDGMAFMDTSFLMAHSYLEMKAICSMNVRGFVLCIIEEERESQ